MIFYFGLNIPLTKNVKKKIHDHSENASTRDRVFQELLKTLGDIKISNNLEGFIKPGHGNPDLITYPETVDDVRTIIKVCYRHHFNVIPMGLNTAIELQTAAPDGGLIINMRKMKSIIEFYKEDFQVTVEAGITTKELNEFLNKEGFYFPVAPQSQPTIGGCVSTRCSGILTPKYITIKENVVRLEVVLPQEHAEVLWTRKRSIKSSAGYDLTPLFIGAEGTLGVITKVTLKVVKIPSVVASAIVIFNEMKMASKTVFDYRYAEINSISKMEIINGEGVRYINMFFNSTYDELPSLFLEFVGNSIKEVKNEIENCKNIAMKNGGKDFEHSFDEEVMKKLWKIRLMVYPAFTKISREKSCKNKENCKIIVTDICIPLSKYLEVVDLTERDYKEAGFPCPIIGHAADGNLHSLVAVDSDEALQKVMDLNKKLVRRAIDADGTSSGEHGIGLRKKEYLIMEHGKEGVDLMKKIKMNIDERNIMNRDKMFSIY